jgi:DNA-binding NarL/FixJ family response regulator
MNLPSVLIADDSAAWRAIIARIVEPECRIVGFATRGDEVIRQAAALQPDVIALDVSMPGISGLQLLPKLRSAMPKAVIVIVTVTSDQIYLDEARIRGADGYVLKRNALADLIPAIRKRSLSESLPPRRCETQV